MTKLNQLIALSQTKKTKYKKVLESVYHLFQKPVFGGLEKTYQPKDEEGDKLPSESMKVQNTVDDLVKSLESHLVEAFDIVASQDTGNCNATANVVVEDVTLLPNVPVTTLIFLEKQLNDLHSLVEKIPTLDTAHDWHYDSSLGLNVTSPVQTHRTTKQQEPVVLYHATPEHPAQTEMVTKDVLSGYWTTKKLSGEMTVDKKKDLLSRVLKLRDAVVKAREDANTTEVENVKIGEKIFRHIFVD